MNAVADFLIAVLEDFRTFGTANKLMFLGFALGALLSPFGALWGWMKRRQGHLAGELVACKQARDGAERRVTALEDEKSKLAEHAPATVLRRFEIERRNNNSPTLVNAADKYMNHHRACFAEACRILADHHLSLWEDGAEALDRARTAAMGALAAAPDDRDLALLLDEIERLQRVEAATPETQEEVREKEERDRLRRLLREAPGDVISLRAIGQKEFDAGRYRIAIVLWERAEAALLAEAVAGPNSPDHLSIRIDLGYATLFAGRLKGARDIIAPLPDRCASAIKPDAPITIRARHLEALLLSWEGNHSEAEQKLEALLPLQEKVQGKEHPNTLTTRHNLGEAIRDQGRAAEAEAMFRDLLPLQEKVQDKEHPNTLTTRHNLARAILEQGRAAETEAMFRDLLPLQEKVQGKEHPNTLTTRHNLAQAILDQSRAAEAEVMFRDLLPLGEKVHGKEHPHTLATRRALARAALEQGIADRARDALASLPEDGGDPDPLRVGQTAMLRGWLADLDGDDAEAEALLDEAEAHLADLHPEHYSRRELARYRETRVPGGAGGTMVLPADDA